MRFFKRFLATILCTVTAMLCIPTALVCADAATVEVKSTLDFSAMPAQPDVASGVAQIKAAGAVDAVNLFVAGNHTPVANPGGYMGEGYYIQKLDAGAGKTFIEVYLDLIYWVGTADPQGYLKVLASTDNINYTEIFSQTEGCGDPWDGTTVQNASIPIPAAAGAQTVYIKVVMQHWTTWEGAAVKTSTLRGTMEGGATVPAVPDDVPTKTISASFDFSCMATDNEREAVRADLKSYGLYDCQNVIVGGNYGNVATPGGYMGEGFVVHKLSAPAGKTLVSAQLDLQYWAYYINSSASPGYLQIMASTDGYSYTDIARINADATKNTLQSCVVDLPMAAGAKDIYVKVVMQHWESFEGAAVKKITINGKIPSDGEGSTGEKHKVELFQAFSDLPYGDVTAQEIGAVDAMNMYFGIDGISLLSPNGGYVTAYATWKLEAAEGETLDDAVFCFVGRTWYVTASQKDNNTLKVLVSTDGIRFTKVKTYHSNDEQSDTQRFELDLTEYVAGASEVYVKMEWLLFDSPHIMGIRSVTLTGNTAGAESATDGPAKTPVSNVRFFGSMPAGTASAEGIGATGCVNLVLGRNGTPLLTAANSCQDAVAVWEIAAAPGETFDNGYLTLVGRIGYLDAAKKDYTFLKVLVSTDGKNFSEVETVRPVEGEAVVGKLAIDLSTYIRGCSKAYVKLFFFTEEDPTVLGLQSLSLVANAGSDYDRYTPAVENVDWPGEVPPEPTTGEDDPNTQPGENNAMPTGTIVLSVVAAVVVLICGAVLVLWLLRKKSGSA